jgi:hypothetical protein
MKLLCFSLIVGVGLAALQAEDFQGAGHKLEYEDAPVKYNDQTPTDAVAQVQHRLATGETKLTYDDQFGYLPALLDALKIPRSSQALVFSKTSLQIAFITPDNPRAIYFNDDVYLGYVPGAPSIEVAAADPKLGGVFYRIDNEETRRPHFVRDQDCLRCHGAERTMGVPGFVMRSIGTDEAGQIDSQTEVSNIDHCTPFADRWAGWYVTGQHGNQTHRGNLVGPKAFARAQKEPNYLGNLSDLREFISVKKYLRPTSDIVSLMVLEHQTKMHNYITRLSYETQQMMAMYGHIRYLKQQENAFLRYLLFTEEAPLTATVSGDPKYTQDFTAVGPFDSKGRSLRDFDLHTRLFKHPCSFLIYSDQFDSMPPVMHDELLKRLHAILTGEDHDPQFASLGDEERRTILEILRETKPNLPAYWRE